MFGEGVSLLDLTLLLKAIRDKDLELQVKVLDGPWERMNGVQIRAMLGAVTSGRVSGPYDIRMRLFDKTAGKPSVPPTT